MQFLNITCASALVAGTFACFNAAANELPGAEMPIGGGTVRTYAVVGTDGAPTEIGVSFSKHALDGLPADSNNTNRCFDLDGSGVIDTGECDGDYDYVLPLPAELASRSDIPFDWAMVNWNPMGHPPQPWSVPHFDVHFYQISPDAVDAMRTGPCGIFMNCDDFQRAIKPVPAKYVNPDHVSVEAAVARMGDHLIDSLTPELGTPPQPFTHTFIFGAYDGHVIFHEVMVTRSFLEMGTDGCADIKRPQAWETAGYYPTRYCFRHEADGAVKIFMKDFVMREAG
jgi:hypothetical protein